MLISARSFNSLIHSLRQNQQKEAQEIAESGTSLIINELNSNFPYLLAVSCQVKNNAPSQQLENPECAGWEDFEFNAYGGPTAACSGRSSNPQSVMSQLYKQVPSKSGYYRLRNYEYLGDQVQGGTAIIQVQGQRLNGSVDNPSIAGSVIVEQEVTIVPKCCNKQPYVACDSASGWGYSLATNSIQLQQGDVIDENRATSPSNANVHCINCSDPPAKQSQPWTEAGQSGSNCANADGMNGSCIAGTRSNGPLDIPEAPTWNTNEWGNPTPLDIWYTDKIFRHQRDNETKHPIDACFTETVGGKKRTHCRINNIALSGINKLDIRPEDGDIRFYVEGNSIAMAGKSLANTGNFGQFSIFGGDAGRWGCHGKALNISGGSEIKAFLHMPCFDINLSGGNQTNPIKIIGSVISKSWNATGDHAQLIVPEDSSKIICETYQICSKSRSNGTEFAALGTNRWNLIQMQR